ncbi:MAG: hypothetical protein B7X00_01515, partial [Legionella sp. 21-45-4]
MSLFACATLGVPTQAMASAMEGYTQLIQYLNEEKSNLALSLQEESSWVVPEDSAATDSARVRIQQQITMTDAEIQGLERLLNNQYAREHELSLEQKKLQDASYTDVGETRLQTRLNELDASRVNNTKLIELIEENLKWVKRYQTLLGQHANAIAFSTLEKNTQA